MKTDILFYELFRHWPGVALQLAGLDPICAEGYEFPFEEIKQSA
jgi:predicted transposase YdaD